MYHANNNSQNDWITGKAKWDKQKITIFWTNKKQASGGNQFGGNSKNSKNQLTKKKSRICGIE